MATNSDVRSSTDAIGIVFGRDKLDGCRASRTMFGTVRYQRASANIVDGDVSVALSILLHELAATSGTLPIAAALPTDECYFATRPKASGATSATPRALLRESLRSSSARLDQMAIDVINWQPDRRTVAGIVAAPIERIEAIREYIAETGHSLQRLEPAAACLISVAPEMEGDRRGNLTTRIFLGHSTLLAATSRGSLPVYWHSSPLPAGDESTGIVSAVRSLDAAGSACGVDRAPEHVVIHGRRELHALMDQQWLQKKLPDSYRWVESPSFEGSSVAQALADKLLNDDDNGFDFVRQHRAPLRLRRVVPYKEIAAYAAAAVVLAAVMWMRLGAIEHQQSAVIASSPPMVGDGTNPKPEKDRLNARAVAISQFLDKRVQWSGLLGEITQKLPDGMRLKSIRGSAAMAQRRKKQLKVSPTTLVLQAEAALDENGDLPLELNTLADSIHNITKVSNHFQNVDLSDVRRTRSRDTGIAGAEFSVVLTNDTKGAR